MTIHTKADFDNLIDRIRDIVENYENNVCIIINIKFTWQVEKEFFLKYLHGLLLIYLEYIRNFRK